MTWIRIDEHRINVEEIVRYSPILVPKEAFPEFHTEIEFSNGGSIYVRPMVQELDAMLLSKMEPKK